MENILCNDQLAQCKQLISGINRKSCNGHFRSALKIFLDYAKRTPCDDSLLQAFEKLLTLADTGEKVSRASASHLLGNFVRKVLGRPSTATIHLPLVQAYQAVVGRKPRLIAVLEKPGDIYVILAEQYRRQFPASLVAGMARGQVIPCGHWLGWFTDANGYVDQRVSRLHCYLVYDGTQYALYDCSINGTCVCL